MTIGLTAYLFVKSILYSCYVVSIAGTADDNEEAFSSPRYSAFEGRQQFGQHKSRTDPEEKVQSILIIVSRLVPFMARSSIADGSFAAALPQEEECAGRPGNK